METKEKKAFVYIVECSDGTLYTGWTTDVEARVATHNSGCGAKYTRTRTPVKLVYSEELENKSAALKREAAIKKLPRAKKMQLIRNANHTDSSGSISPKTDNL